MASVSPQLSLGSFNSVRAKGGQLCSPRSLRLFCLVTKRALHDEVLGGFLQNDACQSPSSVCLSERHRSL